jgi:hypothetical protein
MKGWRRLKLIKGAKQEGDPPQVSKSKATKDYNPYLVIASHLVKFLLERGVIRLTDDIKG